MVTISWQKEVKAKKQHICNFCCQKIQVGETYIISTHKQDGEIYDWKTHKQCHHISNRLKMYDNLDGEGLTADDFQEYIHKEYFDLMFAVFAQDDIKKYSEAIQQLRHVMFREKLWYVIRHYAKLDKASTDQQAK